jgi:hypothetical protein
LYGLFRAMFLDVNIGLVEEKLAVILVGPKDKRR